MPEVKIIGGVECHFPVSEQDTADKFFNGLRNAIFDMCMDGRMSLEELREFVKEANLEYYAEHPEDPPDEEFYRLYPELRPTDESLEIKTKPLS